MSLKFLKLFALFILVAPLAIAQETISDDDLKRYAVSMDSIDQMKTSFIQLITDMVNNNDHISAARYNELSKISDDSTKLVEASATPEEIAFVKSVADKKEEETDKINATFQSLAKDYIGAKTYNAVKTALKEDEVVKTKYEAIMKEIQATAAVGK